MGILILDVLLPVEATQAQPNSLNSALRQAVIAKLTNDNLLSLLFRGPVKVAYRPTRRKIDLPSITIFDSGARTDLIVPFYTRTLQVDVWTMSDLDLAEALVTRLIQLLDHTDLPLPGQEGFVARIHFQTDVDVPMEDATLVRKTLIFREFVYDFGTDYPNN